MSSDEYVKNREIFRFLLLPVTRPIFMDVFEKLIGEMQNAALQVFVLAP